MRGQQLREAIKEKGVAIGAFLDLSEPTLVEMMGYLGYDFVVLEFEHGLRDFRMLRDLIHAADVVRIPALVRLGETSHNLIERMLDEGVTGLMVPHCTSREQVQGVARSMRYPPEGNRGAGVCRIEAFRDPNEKYWLANQNVMLWPIIEDPEGVERVEEILEVPEIDAVCPGPGDLSLAMGLPRKGAGIGTAHPTIQAMLDKVVQATLKKDKLLQIFVGSPTEVEGWVQRGAKIIVYGHDTRLVANLYRQSLARMREGADAGLKASS